MCQYKQFEICFIKIGAILDFDPMYKFKMTFGPIIFIICNLKTKQVFTRNNAE